MGIDNWVDADLSTGRAFAQHEDIGLVYPTTRFNTIEGQGK